MLAVHGCNSSPSIVKPPSLLFDEPYYSNPDQVEMVLSQLRQHKLNDFQPAFANSLDPTKVANVEPVKINLRDVPPNPSKCTSCKSRPYHLLGEAEEMVRGLVDAGVLREVSTPTKFCASSNLL